MPLRGALEDARLTIAFLPLVARTRWRLWRVPVASSSAAWRELATRELDAARARNAPPLVAFEVWRRAHAVKRAARLVPGATCLTQALSLQSILSSCGENTSLILGVDKNSKPGAKINFEAHAWIEWNGRVIIGGPIDRWKPLLTIAPPMLTTPSGESESKAPVGDPSKLVNASSPSQ
ncbi:lasso peptide biosynthesis B2 protein [bacterium]|nr:MAG: lasso peptide biosynthesis B2 protein [bacterium]